MQKKLEYILLFCIVVTFFVPIIVLPSHFIFPFIVPKILLFRGMTLIMFGTYILLAMINWQRYSVKRTPITISIFLFLASFTISTFVGVDWYRSFWDNHERMLGLFTVFHYVLYYVVLASVIKEWKDWRWLMRVFLGAGAVVMFIAVLQTYVNHDLFMNRGGTARVSSTLGNSIYLSGYGLFLMFLGGLLAVKEKGQQKSNVWFWYAIIGLLFGCWGIFLGGTRGAFLGFIAGTGVLLVSYLFTLKEHKRAKRVIWGSLMAGFFVLGVLFIFRQTSFVQNIPAVGRLFNTEISSSNTRVMAWGVAIDAWKEKPFFGWGPNNYYYAFNKYYRPEFLEHGWGETWFDNAHSVILNTLTVQGIIGILIYLGVYAVAIVMLWKKYKQGDIDAHVVSIGSAFLVAHLVSLSTVFENPTSYLYFFFFLAFLNVQTQKPEPEQKKISIRRIPISYIAVTAFVFVLLIYTTDISPARANNKMLHAIKGFGTGGDVISLYTEAIQISSPHIDDMRNDISRTSEQAILNLNKNGHKELAISLFQLVHDESKKNLLLHPLDIRVHIQLAQLCMVGAEVLQDANLLYEAEIYLEEAMKYSPKRQQIQYTLAALKVQLQKGDEAIQILQSSIDNDLYIAEGWWRLALVYKEIGQQEKAKETINKAQEQGVVFEGPGLQAINFIFEKT